MSLTSIVGLRGAPPSFGAGMIASASLATYCLAPPGLVVSSHSYAKRISKKRLLHCVGVCDHVTSSPAVMASPPCPAPYLLRQPRPWSSTTAPSGSTPTKDGSPAPWVLPKVWPPAISATVSSSFIAIRPKVSRMSRAAASGSGWPLGPSGLT